jgi:integrase
VLRVHRAAQQRENGKRMFSAEELRQVLDAAAQPLRAMILLGANCALGNNDISMLPLTAVDLERGWLDYARPKTGIERRCPLWPETVAALREVIATRSAPKDKQFETRVFLTQHGNEWLRVKLTIEGEDKKTVSLVNTDTIAKEMSKLLKRLKIKRPGLSFYALRHTFQTVGERVSDLTAVRSIMGHGDASMSGVYREEIADERLQKVVDAVRAWLFPTDDSGEGADVLKFQAKAN